MSYRSQYDRDDRTALTINDRLTLRPEPIVDPDDSFDEAWPLTLQVAWHLYHAPNRGRRSLGTAELSATTCAPGPETLALPSPPARARTHLHPPA